MGRYYHVATCLGHGGDHPQLLVTGGSRDGRVTLSDAWILDVQSGRWREVSVFMGECECWCIYLQCFIVNVRDQASMLEWHDL